MFITILIPWLLFSLLAGFIGSGRKVGFIGAFFLALILSPLIGIIAALASKSTQTDAVERAMLKQMQGTKKATQEDYKNLEAALKAGLIKKNEYDDILQKQNP